MWVGSETQVTQFVTERLGLKHRWTVSWGTGCKLLYRKTWNIRASIAWKLGSQLGDIPEEGGSAVLASGWPTCYTWLEHLLHFMEKGKHLQGGILGCMLISVHITLVGAWSLGCSWLEGREKM